MDIERKLTGGDQSKDDLARTLAPTKNWVEQIMPAPLAVATMAKLAILSTAHQDFPLKAPSRGFQMVKNPDSFKACLMQVANEGFEAFNLSHVAMDDVRLATLAIPVDMKFVVSILMKGTDREVQVNLPKALASIGRAADTCLQRSKEVVEKYDSVRLLIDELNETGMSTKGANEKEKEEMELRRKNEEMRKKYLEEEQKKVEAEAEQMKKQLEQREKEYQGALNDMPGPWKVLAMSTLESGMSIVTTCATAGISKVITAVDTAVNASRKRDQGPPKDQAQADAVEPKPKRMSAQTKCVYAQGLKMHAEHIDLGQKTLFDGNSFQKDPKDLNAMKKSFEIAERNLAAPEVDPDLKARVSLFYEDVKRTLNKANDDANVPTVKAELKAHHMTALSFQAEACDVLNSPLKRPTPETVKANKESGGGGSMTETAIRNAQAKVETTTAMFRNTQDEYNRTTKTLMETNQMLNESFVKISSLDASVANLKEILQMLSEGLKLLTSLKDQWASLSLFFQDMAALIKSASERTVKFVDTARDARGDDGSINMGDITKNQIYAYARESVTIGYVVHRLASGYVEFSRDHLMEPVRQLPALMVLDKEKDRGIIQEKQRTIMTGCTKAQSELERMLASEKREFERAMNARMKVIKEEFATVTRVLPKAVVEEIKQQVDQGINHSKTVQDAVDEFC